MSGTDLHVIIPAGGAGTRLWPLSRRSRPKFLLDLTGSGRTLLQATVDRLTPRAASITIVTGAAHRGAVLGQLPEFNGHPDRHLVIEPSGRDSMPAIGLATYLVRRRYGADAVVGSFAADHLITGPDVFLAALDTAVGAAREGYVTTIDGALDRLRVHPPGRGPPGRPRGAARDQLRREAGPGHRATPPR